MTVLRDTFLVFGRYIRQTLRNPVWMTFGLMQPLMYLVLFGPLLKAAVPPQALQGLSAYNFFVPGLLIQLGLFGASGVGFSIISELRMGVIERMRVTPVNRVALLMGRCMRDVVVILVQSTLLTLCALPFGLSLGLGGALIIIVLLAMIGLLISSLSYTIGLAVKSEDSFAPIVFGVTLPLLLLSGVLLPIGDNSPGWLQGIAHANPLYYVVNAARAPFNPTTSGSVVVEGMAIEFVLCALAVALAARAFGRAVA